MICKECGKNNKENSNYCSGCGEPFKNDEPQNVIETDDLRVLGKTVSYIILVICKLVQVTSAFIAIKDWFDRQGAGMDGENKGITTIFAYLFLPGVIIIAIIGFLSTLFPAIATIHIVFDKKGKLSVAKILLLIFLLILNIIPFMNIIL